MINRKEASKLLNVSMSTLLRLEEKGKLTPVKYMGEKSKVYYKKEEIERLTSNQKK